LGASLLCIATYPSDMRVGLAALNAEARVAGPDGERLIAFEDCHRLPDDDPSRDDTLESGELVTAIDLPPEAIAAHHTDRKLRERLSHAFALVSVAMRLDGGSIGEVRIALGGVAHEPWRLAEAEAFLAGATRDRAVFGRAHRGRARPGPQRLQDPPRPARHRARWNRRPRARPSRRPTSASPERMP